MEKFKEILKTIWGMIIILTVLYILVRYIFPIVGFRDTDTNILKWR